MKKAEIKLWGLHDGKRLLDVALRTRDDVRRWAGTRMISSEAYTNALRMYGLGHDGAMELWGRVLFNHPKVRIIRVYCRRA